MAKLAISIPHTLSSQEAQKCVVALLAHARQKFAHEIKELSEKWQSDRCDFVIKARGAKGSAHNEFRNESIEILLTIPFIAIPFKGKITSVIEKNFKRALDQG